MAFKPTIKPGYKLIRVAMLPQVYEAFKKAADQRGMLVYRAVEEAMRDFIAKTNRRGESR